MTDYGLKCEGGRYAADLPKPKRKRKPSLVSVAKQVAKAGIEAARYEVDPDTGKISVVVGKADDATTSNPWDEVLSNVKN